MALPASCRRMKRSLAWTIGTFVGAGVGLGTWLALAVDPALPAALAVVYGVGVGLLLRSRSALQRRFGEPTDPELWSGAFGGFATLVSLVVVNASLPLSLDYRYALGLFVLGVALVTLSIGIRMTLERAGERAAA